MDLYAQVPQWRGCYDDLSEYRRIEATSNLPEFAKKAEMCGHMIKGLCTSTTLLSCSTITWGVWPPQVSVQPQGSCTDGYLNLGSWIPDWNSVVYSMKPQCGVSVLSA